MKDEDALASPKVPASAGATDGASGGALGDCTLADLRRGYSPCKREGDAYEGDTYLPSTANQGFLGRPHGWER